MPLSVGDMAILGQLFALHQERLLQMLRLRIDPKLNVRLDPEDLLHETFIETQRRWEQGKRPTDAQPYAWLYRIARDCLIEAYRRHRRAARDVQAELPWPEQSSLQLGFGLVDDGTGPSTAAVREEQRERMRQALALLRDEDRELLWMRYYDGLSFAEAAEVLGITANAAGVRHVRALKRLKELWQELFEKG